MEVVTAVVRGEELIGVLGVADDGVKVDDGVEVAGGTGPFVDHLSVH